MFGFSIHINALDALVEGTNEVYQLFSLECKHVMPIWWEGSLYKWCGFSLSTFKVDQRQSETHFFILTLEEYTQDLCLSFAHTRSHENRILQSLWGSFSGGGEGCSVSLHLNFCAFLGSCLFLILKKEFFVWAKLVGEREHLYRERCTWQACAMFPSHHWRVDSWVLHFCLLVFLMAQFPSALIIKYILSF